MVEVLVLEVSLVLPNVDLYYILPYEIVHAELIVNYH